jgi:hypothetical protein
MVPLRLLVQNTNNGLAVAEHRPMAREQEINLHFICTWTIQTRNRNIEQAQVNGYLAAVMNDMI